MCEKETASVMSSSSVCYFALVAGPRGAGYGAAAASAARPWIGSRKTTRPNDTRTVTYARCRCWLALFQPRASHKAFQQTTR